MFEDYTYDYLLNSVLSNAPDQIDTREGSIFFDAVSAPLLKIAKLYTDLDSVIELAFLDTSTDEYLDLKSVEHGVDRLSATSCKYSVQIEGTTPSINDRFFADGLYFVFKSSTDFGYYVESELKGEDANNVYNGTKLTPVNTIVGLKSIAIQSILEYGTNAETDDNLRNRIREKIAGPAENGNKQHYKTWCESIDGVGRAKIFPLWNGPNTVKAILINTLGLPVSDLIVNEVQSYIDPDGSGLGEGVANIGACFTAQKAMEKVIDISFKVELAISYNLNDIKDEITEVLMEYFKDLALNSEVSVVRISSIGAYITGLPGVLDYSELTINGATSNIEIQDTQVAVLGEVSVYV